MTRRLSDGSLFVPDALDAPNAGPYDKLTTVREGSYWNLVMPYALASGFFPAHSRAARGLVHYVLAHGSRLLGVPRADAHIIYSNKPYGSGLGAVYASACRASWPTTTIPTSSCSASTACSRSG